MMEIAAKEGAVIELGRRDENLARCVVFDVGEWINTYGEGTVQLLHQRCGDAAPYPCVIGVEGGLVRWDVTAADLAAPGRGQAELQYFVGPVRVKSALFHTRVLQSLGESGPVPDDPAQGWVGQVLEEVRELRIREAEDVAFLAEAGIALKKSVTALEECDAAMEERVSALEEQAADSSELDALGERVTALEEQAADSSELDALEERTATLEEQVADLLYEPIRITSFAHNLGTRELGETVTEYKLSWTTNKTPESLSWDGKHIAATATYVSVADAEITVSRTWTLEATDERGAVDTKAAAVSFLNGVYCGAAAAPDAIDSAFVLGLTKTLTGTRARTVTVDVADGQYAWYCLPTRLGTCTFAVGGFEGGFELVDTIPFTNASGYTENYYVYRSSNAGLGSTKVVVS